MATIVRRRNTDEYYVLLGTGLGAYAEGRAQWLFGALEAEDDSKVISVVAVSTSTGDIRWIPSDEVEVVSIDGRPPADIVPPQP